MLLWEEFLVVARKGSMRVAGRALGLSQPTISCRLTGFEAAFGRPSLFDRFPDSPDRPDWFFNFSSSFRAQCRLDPSTSVLERTMLKATSPVAAAEALEAPDESVTSAAGERRESEMLITDWEQETRRLGRALALMTLDLSTMTGPKWAHRFVISVGPVAEDSVLLFYGPSFAALMQLPVNPEYSVPMMAYLPMRYVPVFAKGCMDAMFQGTPVRMQGTVARWDWQHELYRAAFIRLSIDAKRMQRLVIGAFNCRAVERT